MTDNKKPGKAKVSSRKISLKPISEKRVRPKRDRPDRRKTPEANRENIFETSEKRSGLFNNLSWKNFFAYSKAALFPPAKKISSAQLYGYGFVFLALIYLTLDLIFASIPELYPKTKFMHLVNLPFHEAGHIFFIPLGRFMTVLGGSLLQILVPFIVMGVFLLQNRDAFGGSVALWWAAESMMDLSVYINDARAGKLILLGGSTGQTNPDFHDWKNILRWSDLLKYDTTIASFTFAVGKFLMLVALAWGGYTLYKNYTAKNEADKTPEDF